VSAAGQVSAPASGPHLSPDQLRIWVRNADDTSPGGTVFVPAIAIHMDAQHNVVHAQVEDGDGQLRDIWSRTGLEVIVERGSNCRKE